MSPSLYTLHPGVLLTSVFSLFQALVSYHGELELIGWHSRGSSLPRNHHGENLADHPLHFPNAAIWCGCWRCWGWCTVSLCLQHSAARLQQYLLWWCVPYLTRFWVLLIIFVSSPSLVYMGHVLYQLRAFEKERQRKKSHLRTHMENPGLELEEQQRVENRGGYKSRRGSIKSLRKDVYCILVLHILIRPVLEVGFMVGQYILYGFQMHSLYKYTQPPCPNVAGCFVSRPTEKTIFMLFVHSIAAISLLLNVLELFHLGIRKIRRALYEKSGNEGIDDERAPPFHLRKYSVPQQYMICSPLSERIYFKPTISNKSSKSVCQSLKPCGKFHNPSHLR